MPATSAAQEKLMEIAAHTHGGYGGVPQSVGKEFVGVDSLSKIQMDSEEPKNELDIAKAIQAGELSSPQYYETMALFDVRITGTGTSYRSAHDGYVYRPPENFLSDEFVERCNGLPLIFDHPDKTLLTTEEFRQRSIGVIILPYIKGNEVWGIAKVYDLDAAELMKTTHASTSPAVVFRKKGSTESIEIDGKTVLIEGDPSYLEHLAICERGVWDKGGEPSGINLGEDIMADEEKVPAWADALTKRFDAFEAKEKERADAEEAKLKATAEPKERNDAEEEKEEKERKGAEEKERIDTEEKEKEEKADSAKTIAGMKAEIAALNAKLQPLSSVDKDALSVAQAKADRIAQMFGDSVNAPLYGESPIAYRKRLADKFKVHSKDFAEIKFDGFDGKSFDIIEDKIYADAQSVAMDTSKNSGTGRLIPIVTKENGREVTRYSGDPMAWMGQFMSPSVGVSINKGVN